MRGKMLWFNEVKDLGFILTEEGERLSVLGDGFAGGKRLRGRCAQLEVSFESARPKATGRRGTSLLSRPRHGGPGSGPGGLSDDEHGEAAANASKAEP
jgi:hypothetical protein